MRRLCWGILVVVVCASSAFAQTQVRLKLADGSYMSVDDAWESPQGVWYRRGGLSNILPKDRVKKIERIDPVEAAPGEEAPAGERKGWRGRDRRRRGRNGNGAAATEKSAAGEGRQREISSRRPLPNIQDILKKGQTLPVQVPTEPISTKGCRVTAQISLPGRFLVYMPYASKVGVSRKIESREQRAKLREMVTKLLPKDAGGVIVRTVAEGVTEEHFRREIDSLLALWRKINRKKTFVRRAPALLQRETSLTRDIIRDLFTAKVDALHVDSRELYNEIEGYLGQIDKFFSVPATTRNWNTVLAITRILKDQGTKSRS